MRAHPMIATMSIVIALSPEIEGCFPGANFRGAQPAMMSVAL
jgi:hypothetical protein